jgi:TPR repeat protein
LANAAKKRHAKAQALLGDLLWHGAKDVSRQPVKGLAFLSLARQNARDAGEARWVDGLFTTAYSASQTHERESAERLVARWQKRLGREDIHASAPDKPDTKIEPKSQKGADRSFRPDHTAGVTSVGMKRTGTVR